MPRGRPKALSIPELERLLEERRSSVAKLQKKRDELQAKVDDLDRQITAAGGSGEGRVGTAGTRTAGGRARNAVSLGGAIAAVMGGKGPMTVGDILAAVTASGYRSTSANFRGIVNQALIKDKRFQQSGRGSYVMK